LRELVKEGEVGIKNKEGLRWTQNIFQ